MSKCINQVPFAPEKCRSQFQKCRNFGIKTFSFTHSIGMCIMYYMLRVYAQCTMYKQVTDKKMDFMDFFRALGKAHAIFWFV